MFAKTRPFLFLCLLFVLTGAWLLATYSKADLLLAVNGHYSDARDAVMPWWTDWGLGETHVLLLLALVGIGLWKKGKATAIRWGWLTLLTFALPSLMSQFLKSVFFSQEPRPVSFFKDNPGALHRVAGVELYQSHSFPSGHTITAFSIALTLVYLFAPGRPWNKSGRLRAWALSLVLFAWACSVGYSRMYLAEHFFKDVYGGAIIGILTTIIALWLGERTLPPWGKSKSGKPGLTGNA